MMIDILAIFDGLVEREKVLAKDSIKLLAETINYAVSQGEICHRNGFYSVNEILTKIMGFNKSMWKVLRERHPDLKQFIKQETITGAGARGGSPVHMISEFGVFYLAAIVRYDGGKTKGEHDPLVYVWRDPGNKALKVGATVNLEGRKRNLHGSNPFVELIATFAVDSTQIERKLHRVLYQYCIPNSIGWYPDTREVREAINKFMIDNGYATKPHRSLTY